jgi:hypothetical protein
MTGQGEHGGKGVTTAVACNDLCRQAPDHHVQQQHKVAMVLKQKAGPIMCHTHRLRRQQQLRQNQTRSHRRQRLQQRRRMHRRRQKLLLQQQRQRLHHHRQRLLLRRQRLRWSRRGSPSSWRLGRPSAGVRWPGAGVRPQAAGVPGRCLQRCISQAQGRNRYRQLACPRSAQLSDEHQRLHTASAATHCISGYTLQWLI